MEIRRLLFYMLIWAMLGFAVGHVIYIIAEKLFRVDISYIKLTFVTSGYVGYCVGFVGGFIHICRHGMDDV